MLKLFLKGFLIGIAKIIPGVSGSVLAISFGIYEKAIQAISNFFKNPIENFKFLFPLGIGVVIAIIFMSRIILFFLSNYYLPTMLLFLGLIISSITFLFKKINYQLLKINYILIFLLSFSFVFFLTFIGKQNYFYSNNFLVFILIGFIDAFTTVVPGISGTAVMMLLGCYNLLLKILSSLTDFNNIINNLGMFISFSIGIIMGVIIFSKMMNYLLQKKRAIYL